MTIVPAQSTAAADAVLDAIRRQRAVRKEVLAEARKRRDLVRSIAEAHPAARRSFASGSIAHGTAISPLGDADSGAVMDRRRFPDYGPDGAGLPPNGLMDEFAGWILPRIRKHYPRATCELTKRALLFAFNEPVELDGDIRVDPTVDLVLALDRRDAPGLWIPNRLRRRWDPSHPERHTELYTGGRKDLRVRRARVVRLVKIALKNDGDRRVLCSFNVEALALDLVAAVKPIAVALAEFLAEAAREIAQGLTDDPAGVSPPIKLPEGVTRAMASARLGEMAEVVTAALGATSDAEARRILSAIFGPQIDEIREQLGSSMTHGLRNGDAAAVAGILASPRSQKPMRSHGA